jgi:hypothetical protein
LTHGYQLEEVCSNALIKYLKGVDNVLVRVLKQVPEAKWVSVWESYEDNGLVYSHDMAPYEGKYFGDDSDVLDVTADTNVTWLIKPQAFGIRNDYMTYGNEVSAIWMLRIQPEAEYKYGALALLIQVPKVEDRNELEIN